MVDIIAIDIGGTAIKGAVVRPGQPLPAEPELLVSTEHHQGPQGVIDQILEMTNQLASKHQLDPEHGLVSISVPGLVDAKKGIVQLALNLPGWENICLADIVSSATHFPVLVENDANCAALGEWHYVYNAEPPSLIFMTISTGIGAGMLINSQLYGGASNSAGEIGHMSVDMDGPLCHECNKSRGCLTTLTSGTGIANYVKQNFDPARDKILAGLCDHNPENIDSARIEKAAKQGDPLSLRAYERAGKALGQGLVNIIHLMDPEIIVLGGGVLNSADLLMPPVMQTLKDGLLDPSRSKTVKKSTLGSMQGIAGAAVNALQNLQGPA